jgi:hypothetical protein
MKKLDSHEADGSGRPRRSAREDARDAPHGRAGERGGRRISVRPAAAGDGGHRRSRHHRTRRGTQSARSGSGPSWKRMHRPGAPATGGIRSRSAVAADRLSSYARRRSKLWAVCRRAATRSQAEKRGGDRWQADPCRAVTCPG